MADIPINSGLILSPVNWVIVLLMLVFASVIFTFVIAAIGKNGAS